MECLKKIIVLATFWNFSSECRRFPYAARRLRRAIRLEKCLEGMDVIPCQCLFKGVLFGVLQPPFSVSLVDRFRYAKGFFPSFLLYQKEYVT